MVINERLTVTDGIFLGLGSALGLALMLYFGIRAWRESPGGWVALERSLRPRSWAQWPLLGPYWRARDDAPASAQWEARLVLTLGAAMCGFGLWVAVAVILRHV